MKTCTKCNQTKPEDEFSWNGSKRRHSNCKKCRSSYYQQYGKTEKEKKRLAEKSRARKRGARLFVIEQKSNPCVDCGVQYPFYVMQFDHLGENKKFNVAWMVSHGYTQEAIQEEIDKCELVCANCHAERTYQRQLDSSMRM